MQLHPQMEAFFTHLKICHRSQKSTDEEEEDGV